MDTAQRRVDLMVGQIVAARFQRRHESDDDGDRRAQLVYDEPKDLALGVFAHSERLPISARSV
jgi:hypothetical protein